MPRTCLACSSPNRAAIDKAIATGEPLRNIAGRVSISPAALFRHKAHVGQAIVRAAERKQESVEDSLLAQMGKLCEHVDRVLKAGEDSQDHRLVLAAVRESRENLAGVFTLVTKAKGVRAGGDLRTLSDDELMEQLCRFDMAEGVEAFEARLARVKEAVGEGKATASKPGPRSLPEPAAVHAGTRQP